MTTNNSSGQQYSNESDGFKLAGGATKRQLTVTGADVTITGSGTNTYTMPAATDTLVGQASTDTLTNKTLTSPVVNTPTGIVKGDVGLGNVDNTSNATERAATRTLTNATLSGSSNTFSSISADSTIDGTTNKVYTSTDKTKLSGIATGATANSSDATLEARANHTGTQTASTISDFSTSADARVTAAVGSTVQAYDSDLTAFAAKTAPAGAVVGTTDTQTLTNKTLTSPVVNSPTGITKADVGLGNVDNTSDATKNAASVALTNKDLSSGTNTFPSFNQSTTGSAAKWTTARNLAGNSVDGSAAVAFTNKFVVQGTTDAGLTGAQFLGALSTGIVKNTTATGVLSVAAAGTDYVAPGGALGTPSSGTLTNCTFPTLNQSTTGTAAGLSSTLVVGSGGSGAITLTGVLKGNGTSPFTAATAGTDYLVPGGALGTPSSGTLTNTSGLPISGLVASTSTALGVGSVELGNASDTTVTRSAAGKIAVEGVDVVLLSGAQTLTNKTLTSPVVNTPTGIVKADVGLGSVDNTSDATKNSTTATLTSKTISGSSNTLSAIAVSSLTISGTPDGTKFLRDDGSWQAAAATPTAYSTTIGNGSSTSIVVTHSLGTRNVIVSVRDATTYEQVSPDVFATSTSTITLVFATAPSAGQYAVTVTGGSLGVGVADGSVTMAKLASGAVGSSNISATGSPGSGNFLRGDMSWTALSSDASTNTSTSVDSEVALFSSTTGKLIKRATGSGIAKLTSGVLSTASAGTDYVSPGGALGTPSSGTLTNCTFPTHNINGVAFNGSADVTILPPDMLTATDMGYKAWSFDNAFCYTGVSLAGFAGYLWITAIPIRQATTVSTLSLQIYTAGATLTAGQCFAGIYQGGTRLASTADQSTAWQSVGVKNMSLTGAPISVSAGVVYVAFFMNGTTLPVFGMSIGALASQIFNTTTLARGGYANTGCTTAMPSTLATIVPLANILAWAALS